MRSLFRITCSGQGRLLKAGSTWVVDADLQSYFDSIPHDSSN
jgi:hypothetical protein